MIKYASKLSEPLKQCDAIMRNLMLQSQHWDYVEPFMKAVSTGKGQPRKMSLALINDRLRNYYYSNSLEFATDMRRIVTETYRSANDPIEEDFRAQKVKLLQREFEYQFARIRDDEGSQTGGMSKASIMKDPYISKLMKAQELLASINNGMSSITNDVVAFMDKRRERRKQKMLRRQNMAAINNLSVIDPYSTQSPPNKRQRKSPINDSAFGGPKPVNNVPAPAVLPSATPEQIGEWIQNLDAAGQEHLLEILKRNGENIEVDEEGEVELSLENWSNKTLTDVEMYLRLKLNQPTGPTHSTTNKAIVQNQTISNPPYNKPRTTMPEHHLPSHVPNFIVPVQAPTPTPPLDRKTTGGKHISQNDSRKAIMGSERDGSDSSSDGSESSNSSEDDESSSSGDNSSDENE